MFRALTQNVAGRRSSARAILSSLSRSNQPDNPQAIRKLVIHRCQSTEPKLRREATLMGFMNHTSDNSTFSSSNSPSTYPSPRQVEQQFIELDTFVRKFGRVNRADFDQAFKSLQKLQEVDLPIPGTQFLMLIRTCGSLMNEEPPKIRAELLDKVWSTLSSSTKLDISHYNALLRAHIDNESSVDAFQILKDIESRNLIPNRVTYQRLIHLFCQRGDMKGAAEILELMKSKDVPINQYVFNSLILGYGRANDLESASGTVKAMRDSGIEPSSETYTALITVYAEKVHESEENAEKVRSLIKSAPDEEDIVLSTSDYFSIIKGLARSSESTPLIDELLEKVPKNLDYNREAYNNVLDLICDHKIETALKVFKTMTPTTAQIERKFAGNFFVRQLVKIGIQPLKVIQVCKQLHEEGLNMYAMRCAAHAALQYRDTQAALVYLNQLSELGGVRPHYYWPLICQADDDEMLRIVQNELPQAKGLYGPMHDTFTEWIWPRVKGNPLTFMDRCRDSGYRYTLLVSSYIDYLLYNNMTEAALKMITLKQFERVRLQNLTILGSLISKINDVDPEMVAQIVKALTQKADAVGSDEPQFDYPGRFLVMLYAKRSNDFEQIFAQLKGCYERNSLAISSDAAETLISKPKINENLAQQIRALISNEMRPVIPLSRSPDDEEEHEYEERPRKRIYTIDDLEKLLETQDPSSAEANRTRRNILARYCRIPRQPSLEHLKDRAIKRVDQLLEDLVKHDAQPNPGLLSSVMDFYALTGNIEKALSIKSQMPADYLLNAHKILDMAAQMVRHGKLQEAMTMLEEEIKKRSIASVRDDSDDEDDRLVVADSNEFPAVRSANRFLSAVAETTKDPEKVKDGLKLVFDLTNERPNPVILSSLVKVHLLNDNINEAVEEFCRCAEAHRVPPYRGELIKALLIKKDSQLLQKVLDANTQIYGEHNTLLDLAIACVEAGKLKQAKKVLDTPGLQINQVRLSKILDNYVKLDRAKELENLIEVTRKVSTSKERDDMYHRLLQIYSKNNEAEKALNVWTTMQEEDMQMSVQNTKLLGEILERNGIKPPFDTRQAAALEVDVKREGGTRQPPPRRQPDSTDKFSIALKNQDLSLALQIKDQMEREGKGLTLSQYSLLIEALLKNDKLKEAFNIAQRLLADRLFPHPNTVRYLLQRLSIAGDPEGILALQVPESITNTTQYTSLLASAYMNAQRADDLMDKVLPNLNPFPVGGIMAILEARPDLAERVEGLARKKAEEGYIQPINMVWLYFMKQGQYDKAKEIFQSNPKLKDNLLFSDLVEQIRETNDVSLARELVDQVKTSRLTSRAIGLTYTLLLESLIKKGEYEQAEKIVADEIMSDSLTRENRESGQKEPLLSISDINRRVLIELRDAFQRQLGKDVRFQVPPPRRSQNANSEQ